MDFNLCTKIAEPLDFNEQTIVNKFNPIVDGKFLE